MKRILVLMAVTCGCADMDEKPVGWQVDDSEVETNPYTGPRITPVETPIVYESTLILPTGDCAFPSLAMAELPTGVPGADPGIIEGFDAMGCPTELWVNNYAAGALSLTAYMPWNPPPAYMNYVPWIETYQTLGNIKTTERRSTYAGPLLSRDEIQYDDTGEILVRKTWGNDWDPESTMSSRYRESRFHPLTLVQTLEEQKADGVTHWRSRTEVNDFGQPLRTYVFQSGTEELFQEWTYANGRLASMSYHDADMRSESTYVWHADLSHTITTRNLSQGWIDVYQHDAQGRLTRHTQDENSDGQIEYLQTKAYDALGNTISEINEYEFVNGAATRGTAIERAYDGERITWETSVMRGFNMQRSNPNTLSTTRTDYVYADNADSHERNKLVRYPDGQIMREVSRYDSLGHQVLLTQDVGDDGSTDYKVERIYDGMRQLAENATSEAYNQHQEWLYDEQDRLILWMYDHDNDGTADIGTRYRYDVEGLPAYNTLVPHTP